MSEGTELLRTALHARHVAAGAEMGPVCGWEMPRHYGDPQAEYERARARAAVMDVSHVGRIRVRGDGAVDLLERLCTADVGRQEDDRAQYTLLLNQAGGILADAMVVRLESFWVLTVAPARRQAVLAHAQALAGDFGAKVDDQTFKTSMLATVGPAAGAILDRVLPKKPSRLARGSALTGSMLIARYIASRTGPTRLWSLEVMLPNMLAGKAWQFITHKAGDNAIAPAGLLVRDRLRADAGIGAWGEDFDESSTPVSAGLMKAVDLGHDFLGRDAVRRFLDDAPT